VNLSGRAGAYEEYLPKEWSENVRQQYTFAGEQFQLFLFGKKSWAPCFEEVRSWEWKFFRSSGVDLINERHRRIWKDEENRFGKWSPPRPPWKPPREQLSLRTIGTHSVYFAQDPASTEIKIGFSRSVRSRLAGLGRPVRLLATREGNREVESAIHHRFRHARVRGEWFRPTPELLAYIEEISSSKEA
jgi:hypothetical protein